MDADFPRSTRGVGIFYCPLSAHQESWHMRDPSYTTDEFCEAERVSRAWLYLQWRLGNGPRFYYNGNRRRITEEARLEWQRKREAATSQNGEAR